MSKDSRREKIKGILLQYATYVRSAGADGKDRLDTLTALEELMPQEPVINKESNETIDELQEHLHTLANLASHGIDNTDCDEEEIIEACEFILKLHKYPISWKEER